MFWRKARDLVQAITKEVLAANGQYASRDPVNISLWAARAALDIISVAAFEGDFAALSDSETGIAKAYLTLFGPRQEWGWRTFLGALLPRLVVQALPLRRNKEIGESNQIIRDFCERSIERSMERIKSSEGKRSADLLTVAMSSGQFDTADLVNQLTTFLVAGRETTAATLTWATYFLSENLQMQSRNPLRDPRKSALAHKWKT